MTCWLCGLPDPYRGQGDGIGSCECPRCDCCHRAPGDCDCRRDYEHNLDDPDEPFDPWCNDTSCGHRQMRLDRANTTTDQIGQ